MTAPSIPHPLIPSIPPAPVLDGPDADTALEAALGRLATAGDVPLLLATCKAFVRAGVAGLACRLLESVRGLPAVRPEIRRLADELARLPSGETPLASLRGRYAANRAALAGSFPEAAGLLGDGGDDLDGLHVFVTAQGNVQVVRDAPAGGLHFVFPFGNHRRAARDVEIGDPADRGSFLLAGVPSGPLLERLTALRFPDGYAPPVDLVETDLGILALWLHVVDAAPLIASGRLGVFAGPEAIEQYAAFRARSLWRDDPSRVLTNRRTGWTPPVLDAALLGSVRGRVETRRRELVARQARLYEGRTAAGWARRFEHAAEQPLRVLGLTTRYSTVIQHAMRDLAGAFRRRGCVFELVKEPNDSAAIVDTWSVLAAAPFDLVIVINHLRRELGDRVHPDVPFLCWMQDHMPALWCEEAGRSVGPREVVVSAATWTLVSQYAYPRDRCVPSSNLTDLATYSNEPVPPDDLRAFACDVSFVSHGSETPEELARAVAEPQGPAFGVYLARIVELLCSRLARGEWLFLLGALEIMEQAERECGITLPPAARRDHVYPTVLRLFDRIVRHETIHWAGRWARARSRTLRLYGRGWDAHDELAPFACGEVGNGEPLRRVYQASRVNLQVTGYASLHQRLLDAVASGGFVLTRHNPADFVREPALRIRDHIERRGIGDFDALLAARAASPETAALLEQWHAHGQPAVAPHDDPERRRERRLMGDFFGVPARQLTDESYFGVLRSAAGVPHRAAGDLPGFAETTFRDEASLHALLDRHVDDEAARRRIAAPMREAVAAHDTFDALVDRVLDAVRAGLAREPDA